ncbi:acetyl-CoA synthetase-like protein, partial [Aureobasidium melanogenum]
MLLSASIISKNAIACLDANMLNKPRHDELRAKIIDLQPYVIVVENAESVNAAEQALGSLDLQDVVKVSLSDKSISSNSGSWLPFADLCSPVTDQAASARIEDARYDDLDRDALIVYTSGTSSGIPKGCIRDVRGWIQSVSHQIWSLPGDTRGKRALQTTNFRVIAPGCALKAWYDGATVVLTGRTFDPVKFLDAMEEEGMSELVLLPAQLHAVAATPGFELRDKSSVRLIMSGGDIVTSSLIQESKRLFPGAGFMTAWGMSEAGGCFAWPYWDDIESIPFYSGISPLGRVTPGSRIRLVSEDGKVVQRGEFGELHIQSDSVFKSYLAAPEKMDVVYTDEEGRWFKTGDLGMINDAGDVYIVGRLKDVIKRAAISIAPAAIESCLAAFTGSQTAVVGRPHPTLGQEPFAILQSFNGKSESDLSAHVIAMYGPDWVLGGAIQLKTLGLETFPTNATGKIQKLDLLAALAGSSAFAS